MICRLIPLAALLLAGCMATTPPPQSTPSTGLAAKFMASEPVSIADIPDDWWRLYDDPKLDELVRASLAANTDLRVAYANLDGARAALRSARAAQLPQTTIESGLTVDGTRAQPSANTVPSTDWDIGAAASWEIDLFGRLRSSALAARADMEAQEAARDGVRVAVVADTVLAYVDYCGTMRAIAVAQEVVAAHAHQLSLVQAQLDAGEVSPLEVSQVASFAAGSRAAVPTLEAQRDNALYRLATLQGRTPTEGKDLGLTCNAVPQLDSGTTIGDGMALLQRRPDIREAERKLDAAAARIGVARADLYPRINLGGALGLLTGAFDAALTPLVSWSFPNQTPVRARIAQANATEQAALANWDGIVLKALRELSTSLSLYEREARRNHDLAEATSEAQAYARRAAARVRLGDAPGLLQIDAERSLATARLQQAQSALIIAQAQVALFRAMGGGWQSSTEPR